MTRDTVPKSPGGVTSDKGYVVPWTDMAMISD